MRVYVSNDHAGLSIKASVIDELRQLGHNVVDVGVDAATSVDFPDFAEPAGLALQRGEADRVVLICGSGVGMCIAANKMHGVRACVTHDTYSAHQGVEHDGMNALCLGARIIGDALARELVKAFMSAEFVDDQRFIRRVDKINAIEARR